MELPKYARWEHERKFLIPPAAPRPWALSRPYVIEDRYLDSGRMRLRRILDEADGSTTFKLCKKYTPESAYSQPIVNIYLSREEYTFLHALPGRDLKKRRFHDTHQNRTFSIDAFLGPLDGLVLCEVEAPSLAELHAVEFPAYAAVEVTEDRFFTGGRLCQTEAAELSPRLAPFL